MEHEHTWFKGLSYFDACAISWVNSWMIVVFFIFVLSLFCYMGYIREMILENCL